MACTGFICSRNILATLNVLYIVIACVLIGVAAYGKAVAIIATVHVMGGIIGCGVFLLLIAFVGLIGSIKHHQVLLFFYMIVLFMLFLVQFSVACACLALSDAQQHELFRVGWAGASVALKAKTQTYFSCCGYNKTTQDRINATEKYFHPSCAKLKGCVSKPNATCCGHGPVERPSNGQCPMDSCWTVIEPVLHQAIKVAGGLGLFFSFTELMAVWCTVRYRNQKDPQISPSIFL